MNNLLAIEWLKIKKYRTVWILTGLFALTLVLWNYGIDGGIFKVGTNDINILSQAYTFSHVWENIGWWASVFVVFLSILVIILVTNEYQFKTSRQNVIDGWSRMQFYHAKWLLIIALSLFTTVVVFLIGFFFGMANDSIGAFPGHIYKLFYLFILSLNYYGFSLLLSLFLKKSGITISMFFLYCMIVETMICKLINWQTNSHAGNFLPLQCSDELLPFPLSDMLKAMLKAQAAPPDWAYLLASFIWIAIYYFIGRKKLLSSDW